MPESVGIRMVRGLEDRMNTGRFGVNASKERYSKCSGGYTFAKKWTSVIPARVSERSPGEKDRPFFERGTNERIRKLLKQYTPNTLEDRVYCMPASTRQEGQQGPVAVVVKGPLV